MMYSKRFKRVCLFVITAIPASLSFFSLPAWGDNPRRQIHFVSENGRFVLLNVNRSLERVPIFRDDRFAGIIRNKREEDLWGLFDARSAKLLGPHNEKEALKAGYSAVYTLRGDFETRSAFVSDDGNIVVVIDDFSEREPKAHLEVLHFYRAGELVAAYTLDDLLMNAKSVSYTSSHFGWFLQGSLRFDQDSLFLVTTECVPVTFSTMTGAFVSNEKQTEADRSYEGECD